MRCLDFRYPASPEAQAMEFVYRKISGWTIRPSTDPLDVKYDGVMLRDLLVMDERARREGGFCAVRSASAMSRPQRAAVSAHWSAELRAKVAAKAEADKERERRQVTLDSEDL